MLDQKKASTGIDGKWADQKGKLQAKFPSLTDADLSFSQGKKEEMLEKVQAKIGKSKDELQKIIASL